VVYVVGLVRRFLQNHHQVNLNHLIAFFSIVYFILVLQRYSAPEKSTRIDNNDQIISVKTLAESFYTDNIPRNRTKTFTSTLEYPNETVQIRLVLIIDLIKLIYSIYRTRNKAPPISEIWLTVITQE
jgi:hypothetical protein